MPVPNNIEIAKDTLIHTINCPHCGGAVIIKDSSNSFWALFWIPLSILILFSIAKYMVGVAIQKIPFKHMLLELPIDVNTIVSALIISNFIKTGESQTTLSIGVILIIVTFILSFIFCAYRKNVINEMNSTTMNKANNKVFKLIAMCFGWTIFVIFINLICI